MPLGDSATNRSEQNLAQLHSYESYPELPLEDTATNRSEQNLAQMDMIAKILYNFSLGLFPRVAFLPIILWTF